MLRVGIWRAGRGRVIEAPDPLWVGADPDCAVRLEGRHIWGQHAALYERRGRVVLAARGGARVRVDGAPITAPVVVPPGAEIDVGGFALQVRVVEGPGPGWVGSETPVGRVTSQLDDPEANVRRYLTAENWELTVSPGPAETAWRVALERAYPGGRWIERGPEVAFAAPRPPGRSAAELCFAVERGQLTPPIEALVVIVARVLEAVDARAGLHGGVWPDRIWLGRTGEVSVLPCGPAPGPRDLDGDPYVSPSRRMGVAPTAEDDRYALAVLLTRLGQHPDRAAWLFEGWERGAFSVLERAHRAKVDPVAQHVARVVAVLDAALKNLP